MVATRVALAPLLVSVVALCLTQAATAAKLADGCARVYIDMGSNAGTQIRKLYSPQLFAGGPEGNPSEEIFAHVFGTARDDVCTFGFEASPRHAPRLHALQRAYNKAGYRVTLFTHTAVMTSDSNVTFYMSGNGDPNSIDGAASTKAGTGDMSVTVLGVDMAAWMLREVIGRELPANATGDAPSPAILMKSDIENNDMDVMSRLLVTGALCHVTRVYGEHMEDPWLKSMHDVLRAGRCPTVITLADDETGQGGAAYLSLPLPGEADAPAGGLS